MGVAGALNDFGDVTVNVYQYAPNDYGLYNMAAMNEWVMDVYRPLSIQDNNEFRPSAETSTKPSVWTQKATQSTNTTTWCTTFQA